MRKLIHEMEYEELEDLSTEVRELLINNVTFYGDGGVIDYVLEKLWPKRPAFPHGESPEERFIRETLEELNDGNRQEVIDNLHELSQLADANGAWLIVDEEREFTHRRGKHLALSLGATAIYEEIGHAIAKGFETIYLH